MTLRNVRCLYRDADGLCEPTKLLLEIIAGKPHEAELGAPIERVGAEVVMGWGGLDGEMAVYDRQGVGQWLIPVAVADTLTARHGR